jgi:uncharacterized protein
MVLITLNSVLGAIQTIVQANANDGLGAMEQWWRGLWLNSGLLGRMGLFLSTWIGLWLPWAIPISWRLSWRPFLPLNPAQKLPLLAPLYLIAPGVLWECLQAEGRGWDYYGWRWPIGLDLPAGWLLAGMGLTLVFGGEWKGSWQGLLKVALPIGLLALWIGGTEEVIFRGFLQNELAAAWGWWPAALLSSGIFALLHLLWERQQTWPQIPGLWLMGVLLTWARSWDGGSLGLAIGLHAGWVWCLTCLDAAAAIDYSPNAPSWFIGYYRQPLAGLAGITCLLGTWLVLGSLSGWVLP